MKNVLCFGDSNTYGYDPAGMRDGTAVRYAQDVRWCGVAQRDLGEGWHLIEEGLNGRTTVRDDMCHLDTNLNGGERPFVVTGLYDKYLPMDIYPTYLLKAILAGDIDKMENLGIYEVVEEDFALCEFVDPSKIEMQQIIRDGINLMIKEA